MNRASIGRLLLLGLLVVVSTQPCVTAPRRSESRKTRAERTPVRLPKMLVPIAAAERELEAMQSARTKAERLLQQGRPMEAEPLAREALARLERVFGRDSELSPALLALLGHVEWQLGRPVVAVELLQRAVKLREVQVGPNDPRLAELLNSLAAAHHGAHEYSLARPLYERALAIQQRVQGERHPEVATTLNNLAMLLKEEGDYDQAEQHLKRAMAIEEGSTKRGADLGRLCNNLASVYLKQKQYERARPLLERAVQMGEQAMGKTHPELAAWLVNLASALRHLKRPAEARPMLERALRIHTSRLGQDHPYVAATRGELAEVSQLEEKWDEAREHFLAELRIREIREGKESETARDILIALGDVERKRGDLTAARRVAERALELVTRVSGEESSEWATAQDNLALILHAQGELAEATRRSEQALKVWEMLRGPEDLDVAICLNNLSIFAISREDYVGARALIDRSLAIRRKTSGEDSMEYTDGLTQLGLLLKHQGDYVTARALYERALMSREKALGPDSPELTVNLVNLANLIRVQGDSATAISHLQRAIANIERVFGPTHARLAEPLALLGSLLDDSGARTAAIPILERALSLTEKNSDKSSFVAAHLKVALADAHSGAGESARARPLLVEALRTAETHLGVDHTLVAECLMELARLDHLQGQGALAKERCARALAIERKLAGIMMYALSDTERLSFASTVRRSLDTMLSLTVSDPDASWTYAELLFWKGMAWRMLLRHAAESTGRDEATASLAVELRRCRQDLATELARSSRGPLSQPSVEAIKHLTARKEELERRLAGRGAGRKHIFSPSLGRVLDCMPGGWVLVDYFTYLRQTLPTEVPSPQLAAFVVRPGSQSRVVRIELGSWWDIDKSVELWQRLLTARGGAEAASRQGSLVLSQIWEPVRRELGDCRRVLISPDGSLWSLPFAALPAGPNRYLVEDFTIGLVTSADDLALATGACLVARGGVCAVGGLDYDRVDASPRGPSTTSSARAIAWSTDSTLEFLPLPGSVNELEGVEALYRTAHGGVGPIRVLRGSQATKGALASSVAGVRYLHLATHGYWDPRGTLASVALESSTSAIGGEILARSPLLFAGLALSGANNGSSGILSGEEAANLPLDGVELVTLSACESGLGVVHHAEGIVGLRRALLAGGAGKVLSALWQVPDESTARMMLEFYAQLWRMNVHPVEALAAAQRKALRGTDAKLTRPVDWAGFVMTVRCW